MRIFITCFCALWLGLFSPSVNADEYKVVCYFGSWATYRTGNGAISIADLDPTLCTHMIYGFIGLLDDGKVDILDPWNDLTDGGGKGGFKKFNDLRKRNPKMKTMISIGGWNQPSERYSKVVANSTLRSNFVNSIVKFIRLYGFNGLDFDWETPNQRGGNEADLTNFPLLLKELQLKFKKLGLILSVAVVAAESSASLSYDIPNLVKYVDFINLMAYDFHGSWDPVLGYNAPLYSSSRDVTPLARSLNVNAAVHYWLDQGAPAKKLNVGMPAYGRTFKRTNLNESEPGSPASGPGNVGPYTQEAGVLSYLEFCELIAEGCWTVVRDEEQRVPRAFKGDQWISYDDSRSITEKAMYVKKNGLGGAAMWSLESDDVHGICGDRFPILTAIYSTLNGEAKLD